MNLFIKFITKIIVSFLQRFLYYVKLNILKKSLEKKEKEASDAKKISDDAVLDFESAYKLYKSKDKKESGDNS